MSSSHLSKIRENYPNSRIHGLLKFEYIDFIVLTLLYIFTIFINKYVLSVLKFTYPTVFQGWQTLVGVIILKLLIIKKTIDITPIDKSSALNLLPHCMFYVGSIVAGSKALAILPIPVFASISNLPLVCIYLLDYSVSSTSTNLIQMTAGIVSVLAAISIIILDVRLPFADSGYSWCLAHVVFTTAQMLYTRLINPRITEIDKLYYSNLFSVIILAPCSYYLEEAFSALNFKHRSQFRFYLGCILSGILGISFQLWIARQRTTTTTTTTTTDPIFSNINAVAKIIASVLAIIIFTSDSTVIIWAFVSTNLMATSFIPIELEFSPNYQESFEV